MMTATQTTKFEVGKTYTCRSACDHECVFSYTVVRRTEKSVWLDNGRDPVKRRSISMWDDCESCSPQGTFSMSPILRADRGE